MNERKAHLEGVMDFIQQYRSNEINFEKLSQKLDEEIGTDGAEGEYVSDLTEVKEKAAQTYRQAKETSGSAWPEFEKFVTGFETAITNVLKEE